MIENASERFVARAALASTIIAICVVVLGAFVRLTDAGLGCPDWPGCYGHIGVPTTAEEVAKANAAYPERPVETQKAWNEMIHRYLASFLGLVILAMAFVAWRARKEPNQLVALPFALVAVVIFQGILGMWTVTLLLKPAIVTGHLLGGMATTALLFWLTLRQGGWLTDAKAHEANIPSVWTTLALVILVLQIALGGWTSTNYAALACPDLPTCHGQWLPWWDADQAFRVWHGLGQDFEGGVLSNEARVTIHATHRLGAVITFLYIGGLATWLLIRFGGLIRAAAAVTLVLLITQVTLGIANVAMSLPLSIAVAHNGVAALLLLSLVALIHILNPRQVTA